MNDENNIFLEKKMKEYKINNNKYKIEKIEFIENKIYYNVIKRLFDITLSLIGIIISLIPMLIIAILIKLDSKGPVLFKQERQGKGHKTFLMFKFRSMVVDAEKNGAQWAEKDDDRVTRIGGFLRKSRLDEIPQLFNIFAGHMSLVGPRPEREHFYNEFREYIDGFDQRLLIIPGLTGLAQINGGYDLKPEEKIVFDIEYIKKRSILLDLKLIFKTVAIVFNHNGAR